MGKRLFLTADEVNAELHRLRMMHDDAKDRRERERISARIRYWMNHDDKLRYRQRYYTTKEKQSRILSQIQSCALKLQELQQKQHP